MIRPEDDEPGPSWVPFVGVLFALLIACALIALIAITAFSIIGSIT